MPRTTNPNHGDESERIRRITNTPTLILADVADEERADNPPTKREQEGKKRRRSSGELANSKALAKYKYLPVSHLWHKTIDRLITGSAISTAQAESWLKTCQLSMMDLPSGEVVSAHVQTQTSFAAEHIRYRYACVIRFTLQVLTNKQVILFVRGPKDSPDKGPPDGYDVA